MSLPTSESPELWSRKGMSTRTLVVVWLLAFALRLAVVFWAKGRVPPTADGAFYHTVASRILGGHGYTWLWPDGAVTYAAHYPVGYPGMLAAVYALFGVDPSHAMVLNAVLGAFTVIFSIRLAERLARERESPLSRGAYHWLIGLAVSIPTLVVYTPALMTEGVVACVIAFGGLIASGWPDRLSDRTRAILLGLVLGLGCLFRPQTVLLAPIFAWFTVARKGEGTGRSLRILGGRMARSIAVSALAIAVCAPWTYRNCKKMEQCLFVSANGGWNLLIGTFPEGEGAWVAIDESRVPSECREVFHEAKKDSCFGAAGLRRIREHPWAFLALVPKKLRATFDFGAAAAEHLKEASALTSSGHLALGALEIAWQRLAIAFALVALGSKSAIRKRVRVPAWLLVLSCLALAASSAALSWVLIFLLLIPSLRLGPAHGVLPAVLLTTLVVHSVFFGAGRYALPLYPLLVPWIVWGMDVLSGSVRAKPGGAPIEVKEGAGSAASGAVKPSF